LEKALKEVPEEEKGLNLVFYSFLRSIANKLKSFEDIGREGEILLYVKNRSKYLKYINETPGIAKEIKANYEREKSIMTNL
jgi:hypothetical protein